MNKAISIDGISACLSRLAGATWRWCGVWCSKEQILIKSPIAATFLYIAAEMGRLAVVQYLMEQGADVNIAAEDGRSAIFIAAQKGCFEIVRYLVEHGADKNTATDDGWTPLGIAVQEGHSAVATYLRENGAI